MMGRHVHFLNEWISITVYNGYVSLSVSCSWAFFFTQKFPYVNTVWLNRWQTYNWIWVYSGRREICMGHSMKFGDLVVKKWFSPHFSPATMSPGCQIILVPTGQLRNRRSSKEAGRYQDDLTSRDHQIVALTTWSVKYIRFHAQENCHDLFPASR